MKMKKSELKCLSGIIAGILMMAPPVCAAGETAVISGGFGQSSQDGSAVEAAFGGKQLGTFVISEYDDSAGSCGYELNLANSAFDCDGEISVSLPPSDKAFGGKYSLKNADRPLIWIPADSVRITGNCRIVPAPESAVRQFDVLVDTVSAGSGMADIADGADPLGIGPERIGVLEYKGPSATLYLPAGMSLSPQNTDLAKKTVPY